MEIKRVTKNVSVSGQIQPQDIKKLYDLGFRSIVCNRPDGESPDQPSFKEIQQEAQKCGIETLFLPVVSGQLTDEKGLAFKNALREMPAPLLAYCRTGTRSVTLWSLARSAVRPPAEILNCAKEAGYDVSGVIRRIVNGGKTPSDTVDGEYDIVVVGAGAAGVAVSASILNRNSACKIAIIEPADIHYYQPGWTLVGGGVFTPEKTVRTTASLIPKGATWIKASVAAFEPESNSVLLHGCRVIKYTYLVVCPGLKLDWGKIEGLEETLGKNGVTSNYRFDLAPYTWECVQKLKTGKALFTQPPMPIKCAGAPQKAMYLSSDHWRRQGCLKDINVEFYNAGGVLFGVKDYVPALMEYVDKYNIQLNFMHNLVRVDGPSKMAYFKNNSESGNGEIIEVGFDMLHVVPPQSAPDFIKASPLVDEAGWVDVDQSTLRHKKYTNIYSLGDVMNAPNAKTAAAARVQAPVVANNLLSDMGNHKKRALYNGYGSCPLTVERGKIVLAEFGYGGKILNTFPKWILNGMRPTRLAWYLKETLLPPMYWQGMLKGKEWLVTPKTFDENPDE